jgi:hypothetical protein
MKSTRAPDVDSRTSMSRCSRWNRLSLGTNQRPAKPSDVLTVSTPADRGAVTAMVAAPIRSSAAAISAA